MKNKFALLVNGGLLAAALIFAGCDNKNDNDAGYKDRNLGTTGTGSGTGLNSDFDNNSTTGAIDPGQEQYEKENESHFNQSTSANDTTKNTTGNTGTRVGPTGGNQSTTSPSTTGHTSRGPGNPGYTTKTDGNQSTR